MAKRFGELLLEAGVIDATQLDAALSRQAASGGRIGANLVELGFLGDSDLARWLSRRHGVEVVDLAATRPDPVAVALIPTDLARRRRLLPLRIEGATLVVAAADPSDVQAIEELRSVTGFAVELVLADDLAIDRMVAHHYPTSETFDLKSVMADLVRELEEISASAPPPAEPINEDEGTPATPAHLPEMGPEMGPEPLAAAATQEDVVAPAWQDIHIDDSGTAFRAQPHADTAGSELDPVDTAEWEAFVHDVHAAAQEATEARSGIYDAPAPAHPPLPRLSARSVPGRPQKDLLAEAQIYAGYGLADKALARLLEIRECYGVRFVLEAGKIVFAGLDEETAAVAETTGAAEAAEAAGAHPFVTIPVVFATDRETVRYSADRFTYSGRRGELEFGLAHVALPEDPRLEGLERPKAWQRELRDDPRQAVSILRLWPIGRAALGASARYTLREASARELLVFVHGFNTGFADALRRTAQLAYDLHFPGVPVLYSWPSEGAPHRFTADEAAVRWSFPHFAEFLRHLVHESRAQRVHVVALGMGCILTLESLRSFAPGPGDLVRLGQVVFVAPDVDAATFAEVAAAISSKAERVTLYASARDQSLRLSRAIHGDARAGDPAGGPVLVEGVDAIDASCLDTSLLGHSLPGERSALVEDLFALLRAGKSPDERPWLEARVAGGRRYWLFSAS